MEAVLKSVNAAILTILLCVTPEISHQEINLPRKATYDGLTSTSILSLTFFQDDAVSPLTSVGAAWI